MKNFIYGKYKKEEIEAYNDFKRFASYNNKMFNEYFPEKYGSKHDITNYNYTGGTSYVELKKRRINADKYEDCFIELGKWEYLINEWRINKIMPIYINFIGDSDNVYIWFLPQVKTGNFHPNVLIDGEYEDRIGLKWNEAHHYVYNKATEQYIYEGPTDIKKITENILVTEIDYDTVEELRIIREKEMN